MGSSKFNLYAIRRNKDKKVQLMQVSLILMYHIFLLLKNPNLCVFIELIPLKHTPTIGTPVQLNQDQRTTNTPSYDTQRKTQEKLDSLKTLEINHMHRYLCKSIIRTKLEEFEI